MALGSLSARPLAKATASNVSRVPRQDVTRLFMEAPAGEDSAPPPGASHAGVIAPLPIPDPLGVLERLTKGRVRDPLRQRALQWVESLARRGER